MKEVHTHHHFGAEKPSCNYTFPVHENLLSLWKQLLLVPGKRATWGGGWGICYGLFSGARGTCAALQVRPSPATDANSLLSCTEWDLVSWKGKVFPWHKLRDKRCLELGPQNYTQVNGQLHSPAALHLKIQSAVPTAWKAWGHDGV